MGARRIGLLGVIGLLGCGGESTTVGGGGLPLEDLPGAYAEQACGQYDDCFGTLWDYIAPADCVGDLTDQIADGTLPRIQAAIDAGTVTYDPEAAEECLDAMDALGCDRFDNQSPDECDDALVGHVPLGDDCGIDAECEGDAYCLVEAACPGTCTPLEGEGDACDRNEACEEGLVCQGTCVEAGGPADDCRGTSAPDCGTGYLCVGGDADTTGTCRQLEDVMTEAEGAPCNILTGELCEAGSSCVLTAITPELTFECQSEVATSACTIAFPDQCGDGEWCSGLDPDGGDVDGTCEPTPGVGDRCAEGFGVDACEGDLVCDLDTHTCTGVARIDGNCESDAGCFSGQCESGTCVEPDLCEVPD